MKNINVFAVTFVLASCLSMSVHAARWVIKNPKVNVESVGGFQVRSTINLENQYVVVESESRMSAAQLANVFAAESAFEDIKIAIDNPKNDDEELRLEKGWHTETLEYSNLNQKYTGQGVIVAVLDTGVDYRHPALEKKMWKNKKEIPVNGIDDDRNGLIDDHHGYNFNDNLSDPTDTGSHGTHCAGIIAAEKNKDTSAQGVAPDVQVMPLVIIGSDNYGFLTSAAQAVKYATDNGAKVLSNSWRIYESWETFKNPEGQKMLEEAISYAGDHGVIFVAAAGNETTDLDTHTDPIIPLSFKNLPNMIGIASSSLAADNTTEEISYFSNYGTRVVSVAAPGSAIYSTTPYGQWANMSGTSMATPIVAGTLARGLSKGYNMREAISELKQTSNKSSYWQQYISHGRINIKKYLE